MTAGSMDFAPNRERLSRVCKESTTPVAASGSATKGKDFASMESSWRRTSAISKGGVTIDLAMRQEKKPKSPIHSTIVRKDLPNCETSSPMTLAISLVAIPGNTCGFVAKPGFTWINRDKPQARAAVLNLGEATERRPS